VSCDHAFLDERSGPCRPLTCVGLMMLSRSLRAVRSAKAPTLATARGPIREPDESSRAQRARPEARGKFLYAGDEKLLVRGVTYGTFRPNAAGEDYPEPPVVEDDFKRMAANGINALRVYSVPPRWLLDSAERNDLRVMVDLPWEQHVAFLNDVKLARSIRRRVAAGARACAGHESVLCYAIGNEIPASIVRWFGPRRIERFLRELYDTVKHDDPESLVTYVNYPTTEYLELPFLDVVAFNVYLESREQLAAYLARLHNLADERPLLMAEIGLDSLRHGEERQAAVLDWQVRTAFESGCAGLFAFSWTDEWFRRGHEVKQWRFGLTTADREPKASFDAVRRAYAEAPFAPSHQWPRVSVVVCTYNGERTIRDTLEALAKLDYPDYEVIVVNDGSTDGTESLVREYDVRLISTENQGLSCARNVGLEAATGTIVAYTDDDAYPDPQWLKYLARAFSRSDHVGIGGPNIMPAEDGPIAECVANSPGGPSHVLLCDEVAEHIPGCNMAFRRSALRAIGGFDAQYRTAGDDVDVCWRLQQQGWTLGFHPSALVWHHRRDSIKRYLKQQVGYGRAEALLERKWPAKFNTVGHVPWNGRIYGRGLTRHLGFWPGRIYQGVWGSAPFQSVYQPAPGKLLSLPLMPEWYLVIAYLSFLTALGAVWSPLLWAAPLLALAVGALVVEAGISAARARFGQRPRSRLEGWKWRGLTAFLHLAQPAARLYGRLRHGLTPWRLRRRHPWQFPRPTTLAIWSEEGRSAQSWLKRVESALVAAPTRVLRGDEFDRWDLGVRGSVLGGARLLMAVEEHGAGRQYLRFRIWPRHHRGLLATLFGGLLAAAALLDGAWIAAGVLGASAFALAAIAFCDCGAAIGNAIGVLRSLEAPALEASPAPETRAEPTRSACE
jgi:GT2 family glycosyltransferase